jgi:tRNA A37 threonylcarbamoyladenosine modification protein TsaB
MLDERGLTLAECNAVCVSKGPGSYTSLRVGVSTAKGLCFGSGKPLIAVGTLDTLVAQAIDEIPANSREMLVRDLYKAQMSTFPEAKVSYKQNVANKISESVYRASGVKEIEKAYELRHEVGAELMRTKYCIRHELGMCPIHQGAKNSGPLFLLNNGRRLTLEFDCRNCEMTIK